MGGGGGYFSTDVSSWSGTDNDWRREAPRGTASGEVALTTAVEGEPKLRMERVRPALEQRPILHRPEHVPGVARGVLDASDRVLGLLSDV